MSDPDIYEIVFAVFQIKQRVVMAKNIGSIMEKIISHRNIKDTLKIIIVQGKMGRGM